jgi:hypothetical protein
MNIENFYTFSSKLLSSTVQAHAITLSNQKDHNGLFDQHRLIKGVYDKITFPVIFRQEYGKNLQDVLDTGWAGMFLISDKIKTILEENQFTGWKTYEIKVFNKEEQEIHGYHGLSIIGRCGMINYSKSEILQKNLITDAPLTKFYKGLYVGLEEWDGSDFFLPDKYFGTIITNSVAEILKSNMFTNIKIQNLAEIEIPHFSM